VKRHRAAAVLILVSGVFSTRSVAQQSQSSTQPPASGSDATQSFISPLGLGSGATLAVTQKGTSLSASVDQQFQSRMINYWQVGLSGTTNRTGDALVYSSRDADAPGFKAKVGVGRSSFQAADTTLYGQAATKFLTVAWCMDIAKEIGGTLPGFRSESLDKGCRDALDDVSRLLDAAHTLPEGAAPNAAILKNYQAFLSMLKQAKDVAVAPREDAKDLAAIRKPLCKRFAVDSKELYKFCFESKEPQPTAEEQRKPYPSTYAALVGPAQPPAFYYKASLNWLPALTSIEYRAVSQGIPDLATPHEFDRLLNSGALDIAFYYKAWSLGIEAAFGDTVNVSTQNVCQTTSVGTYSAQQCQVVTVGEPVPKSSTSLSAALSVNPLPFGMSSTLLRPGAQLVARWEEPSGGGFHKTELSIPLYVAPLSSPFKLVVGIQPKWSWNTDPKIGNNFAVSVFVGARPQVSH
jgi:hypothetical protein